MAYLNDLILDNGLAYLTANAERLAILSSAPSSYADAVTKTIAYKDAPTVAPPADRTPNGRQVTVSAIADGVVDPGGGSASGEVWALLDVTGTALLAWGDLGNDQLLVLGNTFTLTSFPIGIPDAA
ncbi:MAG TPA: hypothetical protein VLC09_09215 [Polyangiaceae bacterium]|nr:hypothetical protein [Polyangiaceae bacterium]